MIYNKYFENINDSKIVYFLDKVREKVNFKNIFFILLSFIMYIQTANTELSLFTFVLFAIASVFNVPLILVLISSIAGLAFSGITAMTILKLLAFFTVFTLVTSLIDIEGLSRKYSVFIKFILSLVIVEGISQFIAGTLVYNLFGIVGNMLIISALYFIFISGIYVILNLSKGYIYSKEESVAMVVVIAILLSVVSGISISHLSLYNILVTALVLIYGWKSGAVSGVAAGIVIGLWLNVITGVNISYVIALGVSGGIAGILSRIGKVAVVIGFVLGNIYLAYYTNGFSELNLRVSEIVFASVTLLFMPKSIEARLTKLFNKNSSLNEPYENILDVASNTKSKIGAVSEIFNTLSDISIPSTPEDSKETREIIKKYISDYIENTCISCDKRKECMTGEKLDVIVDYISLKLEQNEKINSSMLEMDCELAEDIIDNVVEVYNSMKLMRILKQKERENSIKLSKQYKEVSHILSNIANNIKNVPIVKNSNRKKLQEELKFHGFLVYEDDYSEENGNIEYVFVTDILNNIDEQKKEIVDIASDILEQNMTIKLILNSSKKEKSKIKIVSIPDYEVQVGIAYEIKEGEEVSGDSYLSQELQDLKQLTVISDGAGNGVNASKGSTAVINMLEKLLSCGFEEEKAIEIINSVIKMKINDTEFSTLDAVIIDLRTADSQFIKLGSAPTYILEDSKVITINNVNIPVGLVKDTEYVPVCKKLKQNSIIIQVSDGVVEDDMKSNDNYFTRIIQNIDVTKSAKVIADELKRQVLREKKNAFDDDITIIVSKINKVK